MLKPPKGLDLRSVDWEPDATAQHYIINLHYVATHLPFEKYIGQKIRLEDWWQHFEIPNEAISGEATIVDVSVTCQRHELANIVVTAVHEFDAFEKRAYQARSEAAKRRRSEREIIAKYADTTKNYADIWDELSDIPANERVMLVERIMEQQRDRIDREERRRRRQEIERQQSVDKKQLELQRLKEELLDSIDDDKFDPPKRKIDLGD